MTLLKDAGVPTPKFGVATTSDEAKTVAEELGGSDLVIKAQVRFWKFPSARDLGNFLVIPNVTSCGKDNFLFIYYRFWLVEEEKGIL